MTCESLSLTLYEKSIMKSGSTSIDNGMLVAVKDYPSIHICQLRLIAELAILVITDPSKRGCISSVEFVQSFLNSSFVSGTIHSDDSGMKDSFVAAFCRAYVRVLPSALVSVITKYEAMEKSSVSEAIDVNSHASGVGRYNERVVSVNAGIFQRNVTDNISSSVFDTNSKGKGESEETSGKENESGRSSINMREKLAMQAKAEFDAMIQYGLQFLSAFSP